MLIHKKPCSKNIPGFWEPEEYVIDAFNPDEKRQKWLICNEAFVIDDFLNSSECTQLIKLMQLSPNTESVSVQGGKDSINNETGSLRTTIWSEKLATSLWKKLEPKFIEKIKRCDDYTSTDWWQNSNHNTYKVHSISPLLRFMRYENGGQHYPHYDTGFIYPDSKFRTLKSFVIYLTSNFFGGSTRFIEDNQKTLSIKNRNHDDWNRTPSFYEIIKRVNPIEGRILTFDHRMCHDVSKYNGDSPRIIIRGDIIYEGIESV